MPHQTKNVSVSAIKDDDNNVALTLELALSETAWGRLNTILSARGITRDELLSGGGSNPERQSIVVHAVADALSSGG